MENFVLYDEIGCGNERTVYKGRKKGTIEYVSIHCIGKSKRQLIQNNVRINHELDHRNIVQFHEWYETTNHLWLVVELCTGNSLQNILLQDLFLPEATVKMFAKDLLTGLSYLHSMNIIYVDLCPKKILLDGDGTLKYGNFSLAKFDGENDYIEKFIDSLSSGKNSSIMGSPVYMAPEVICGEIATKESDLWCLGCVIYEMFTGRPPFTADNFETLCDQIMEAKLSYPTQGENVTHAKATESLYLLIQGLLQPDIAKRIDWLELCLHPFWDGELNHLTEILDSNKTSRNMLVDSLQCSKLVPESVDFQQNYLENSHEKELDPVNINSSIKERPETVPKIKTSKLLHTKSLNILDERPSVESIPSEKPKMEAKEAWKGTYKLECGLVIMDLTEIDHTKDNQSMMGNERAYSKSRVSRSLVGHPKYEINCNTSMNLLLSGLSEVVSDYEGTQLNVMDHLYHATDLQVTPIAENAKLAKIILLKWDANLLGFHALNIEKLRNGGNDEVKTHIATVFHTYIQVRKSNQDKSGIRQKMQILAYLSSICKYEEVSNVILKENHMKHLSNELKLPGQFDLKTRLGRVTGIVASNTTYIPLSFNMGELFTILADQIKQNFRNIQLKNVLLPVIGEFLFFAATQEENEGREIQLWEPSAAVFTIIVRCLQQEDDYVARLIAAKIIENVLVTTGRYCKKFLTNDIGLGLWNLFIHAASDIEKTTAASGLCRISMHSSTVLQHVSDRAGFSEFQKFVVSGIQKTQQSFVTIFVTLLSSNVYAKKILQGNSLIQKIMHNLDSASLILRGKIYLLLAEIFARSHEVLLQCFVQRLITYLERDGRKLLNVGKDNKEMLEYVQKCLAIVVNNIVNSLPLILEGIVHILDAVTGRHHPNPAQTKQLKIHLPLLSIGVHLVTSSLFRKRIVNSKFIQYMGKLLIQIKKVDSGEINLSGNATFTLSENATSNVFSIIEAMAQHPPILLDNFFNIVTHILPVLASFTKSDNGNLRILSMKLFSDIATLYMDNEQDELRPQNEEKATSSIFWVLEKHFLPDFENLLRDQDPLPSYCLKLLYSLTERFPNVIRILVGRGVLSNLFTMMQLHQGDISSTVLQSIVGVFNNIISNKDVDFMTVYKQSFIEYLTTTFIEVAASVDEEMNSNTVSPILLQLLDTLHHMLKKIDLCVKNILVSKAQPVDENRKEEAEKMLEDSHALSELNGILMNLLIFDDSDIREWACRCLLLSAEIFGGTYEECFGDENIECLCQALRDSTPKRQKQLLRIIRRFISSNSNLEETFKTSDTTFKETLENLFNTDNMDSDGKTVRSLSQELFKLLNFNM